MLHVVGAFKIENVVQRVYACVERNEVCRWCRRRHGALTVTHGLELS